MRKSSSILRLFPFSSIYMSSYTFHNNGIYIIPKRWNYRHPPHRIARILHNPNTWNSSNPKRRKFLYFLHFSQNLLIVPLYAELRLPEKAELNGGTMEDGGNWKPERLFPNRWKRENPLYTELPNTVFEGLFMSKECFFSFLFSPFPRSSF